MEGEDADSWYSYSPLVDPSSQIRTIRLDANLAKTARGEIPQCSLTAVSFDSQPAYTAISYAWGDMSHNSAILIDGKYKAVTSNLASFLNNTVTSTKAQNIESRTLWIDAISMDQGNDAEKSEQVRIMGQIYNKASKVVVWLGDADADSHLAFRFFRNLSEQYTESEGGTLSPVDRSTLPQMPSGWLEHIDTHYTETLAALESLISRPWWSRIWVQQEIFNAPFAQTSVICGGEELPWEDIAKSQIALNLYADSMLHNPPALGISNTRAAELNKEMFTIIQRMIRVVGHSYHQMRPQDPQFRYELLDLLVMNSIDIVVRVQATLEVDYVYSLLSMACDPAAATLRERIEYSKPVQTVYTELAEILFEEKGRMMLGFCGIDASGTFPSWVPDWSRTLRRMSLCWRKDIFASVEEPQIYSAGGPAEEFWYLISGSKLQLRGAQVDCVGAAGLANDLFPPFVSDGSGLESIPLNFMSSFHEFQHRVLGQRRNLDAQALWRIPIADQDTGGLHLNVTRAAPSRAADYNTLVDKVETNDVVPLASSTHEYTATMQYVVSNRMPFLSVDGRLGLGPNTMLPDDRIFLISGCQTPFVLRDTGNGEYRIIGEAFVHGIMDGEALTPDQSFETLVIV